MRGRGRIVAGVEAELGAGRQRPGAQRGRCRYPGGQGAGIAGLGFCETPTHAPPKGERHRKAQCALGVACRRVVERASKVRRLDVERVEPPAFEGTLQVWRRLLGQSQERITVAIADHVALT